ncbi:Farnesyl diphosphate synthase [Buchnera aphidicola (Neophyllaphis podocarpi)]|uniref:polyprenyl synthetase family protein n=1 Tax=Buchnera aphidicola TaxID=9 RepID=UPI003464263E
MFIDYLNFYNKRINNFLISVFNNIDFKNSKLFDAMKYSTLLGGKRIRPCLIYFIGDILNVNLNNLDVIAATIEVIHSYSLIHDDLPSMDNSLVRRGKPSCHAKFNEFTAILSGDALQSLAFSILSSKSMFKVSSSIRLKMIYELSKSIGISGLCMGQYLDLKSKDVVITKDYLEKVFFYKTCLLINTSIKLVCLNKNISRNHKINKDLYKYSTIISLAYQINDDISDFKYDKIVNKKFKNKKYNYVSLVGLDRAKFRVLDLYNKAIFILKKLAKKNYLKIELLKSFTKYMVNFDK